MTMNFGAENNELRLEGMPKPDFLGGEITGELDVQEECMHLRQKIEEDCLCDPEYIWRINQLCESYSILELEQLLSKYSSEEASAKNELLRSCVGEQENARSRLRNAMMATIMLKFALANNKE